MIKGRFTTHNIKQLGFNDLQAFVLQINFSNGGQERIPQTQQLRFIRI
jgi:hypothetical protein